MKALIKFISSVVAACMIFIPSLTYSQDTTAGKSSSEIKEGTHQMKTGAKKTWRGTKKAAKGVGHKTKRTAKKVAHKTKKAAEDVKDEIKN